MSLLESAVSMLIEHWGHKTFRTPQAEVIQTMMEGRDVIAVLPTGLGKSCIYQIAALLSDGTTLVVSPLIALMKDQVDDCLKRGIPASYVNTHVPEGEQAERLQGLVNGDYKVFYFSPERIANLAFREAIDAASIDRLVIDEAHCASLWGHDFRPAYQRINELPDLIHPRPPVAAFTATATSDIVGDIAQAIGLHPDYESVVADPIRPNLHYSVADDKSFDTLVKKLDLKAGRHVVYTPSRRAAEETATEILKARGQVAMYYHAGMTRSDRETVQDAFKGGDVRVIVATCAFGMGIDVPDIRTVIHRGAPGSLEAYSQESGRAGRDGKPSRCVLIPTESSFRLHARFVSEANPLYDTYEKLWSWLNANLGESEELQVSDKAIAELTDIGVHEVSAALQTMNAYGLVERPPVPYGTMARANIPSLRQAAFGAGPDSQRRVARAVWDLYTHGGQHQLTMEFGIDREEIASAASVSYATASDRLRQLEAKGVLSLAPLDYSRTTRLVKGGEALDDVLPTDMLDAKRARDEYRLAAMKHYAALDEGEHADYLRSYFLQPAE